MGKHNIKQGLLDKSSYVRYKKRDGTVECYFCRHRINLNDKIVRRNTNHNTKLYHEECAKGLNII